MEVFAYNERNITKHIEILERVEHFLANEKTQIAIILLIFIIYFIPYPHCPDF